MSRPASSCSRGERAANLRNSPWLHPTSRRRVTALAWMSAKAAECLSWLRERSQWVRMMGEDVVILAELGIY